MGKLSTIKARVRWLRAASGLSARGVAEGAGIAHTLVSYLEDGSRLDPRSSTMTAIAQFFGVTLDWLIRGVGPEPEPEKIRAVGAAAQEKRSLRARAANDNALAEAS
jgi:transcriptional regulator with XRE-family HTH domain